MKHEQITKQIKDANTTHKCCFQDQLFDESAFSCFEVLTKPIHKCNEDRPFHATQYQDISIQYQVGFNFVTGKQSHEFKDIHLTVPNKAPSITPYTKADTRNGYVIPQELSVYRKSENNMKFFANKKVWRRTS